MTAQILLVLRLASAATAGQDEAADPEAIMQEVRGSGARVVLKGLYQDEDTWESLLARIGGGSPAWLEVATLLKTSAEGGASYELSIAVGEALAEAPEDALRALREAFDVETVCGEIALPSDRKEWTDLPARIDQRVRAVAGARAPDIQAVREACLRELRALRARVQDMH